MNARDIVAALKGRDADRKHAAVSAGDVSGLDEATTEAALALAGSRDVEVASSVGWLARFAAAKKIPISGAALAKALRTSSSPDGLLRAAYELARRGPLAPKVVDAIPWSPPGGDLRRMAARALGAHAIASDDQDLADRLLQEKHREFRAGVHIVAIESKTRNATRTRLLEHAAKVGEYRKEAKAILKGEI